VKTLLVLVPLALLVFPAQAAAAPAAAQAACFGEGPTLARSGVLLGAAAEDRIARLDGDDRGCGLGGDDHLVGGPGADLLDGGLGVDTCVGDPAQDEFTSCGEILPLLTPPGPPTPPTPPTGVARPLLA
jgi:Ca2+-binding RTX toxin-like protein